MRERSSMTVTLVVPTLLMRELEEISRVPIETAGVLLASVVETARECRLLAREYLPVPDSEYLERRETALLIGSGGYVPALARAEQLDAAAIWVHTHPGVGSNPTPSSHDQVVDQQLADVFRTRTGSVYYGALILSPGRDETAFSGHVASERTGPLAIERLWTVGDRLRLQFSHGRPPAGLSPAYDRNIRAFGAAVQRTVRDLRIGIVGCGGTGSSVAEQLVRLGARDILLIDPDNLSATNVTRVYGSTPERVGEPKVAVLNDHLTRIANDANIQPRQGSITSESVAQRLCDRDVVFGCTDDNAGRLVLSRLATYLLCPVFDCGVLLSSSADGELSGIHGRITILTPGHACLVCRNRIDVARASAELLARDEHARLAGEGYAPALGQTEPAVVTFTTLVAAAAVSELLERLIGYGPQPVPSEILLRCHDREISTNIAQPHPRHYCHPSVGKIGRGITNPFLEQTWAQC